jgi:hypothetical protein
VAKAVAALVPMTTSFSTLDTGIASTLLWHPCFLRIFGHAAASRSGTGVALADAGNEHVGEALSDHRPFKTIEHVVRRARTFGRGV